MKWPNLHRWVSLFFVFSLVIAEVGVGGAFKILELLLPWYNDLLPKASFILAFQKMKRVQVLNSATADLDLQAHCSKFPQTSGSIYSERLIT